MGEEKQQHHNNVNVTIIVFTKCQVSLSHFMYINLQFIFKTTLTVSVLLSSHFTDKESEAPLPKKGPRAGRRQRWI